MNKWLMRIAYMYALCSAGWMATVFIFLARHGTYYMYEPTSAILYAEVALSALGFFILLAGMKGFVGVVENPAQ